MKLTNQEQKNIVDFLNSFNSSGILIHKDVKISKTEFKRIRKINKRYNFFTISRNGILWFRKNNEYTLANNGKEVIQKGIQSVIDDLEKIFKLSNL